MSVAALPVQVAPGLADLAEAVSAHVRALRSRAPFAPVVVAVPSVVVGEYLKLAVAERLGAAYGIETPPLRAFFAQRASLAGYAPTGREELPLRVLDLLERERTLAPALAAYLGDPADALADARALELARELAGELGRTAVRGGHDALVAWAARDTWDGSLVRALLAQLATERRYLHPVLPPLPARAGGETTFVVVPSSLPLGLAEGLARIAESAPLTLLSVSVEGFVEDELPDDASWLRLFGRTARVRQRRLSRMLGALSPAEVGKRTTRGGSLGVLAAHVARSEAPQDATEDTILGASAPSLHREIEDLAARLAERLAEPLGPVASDVLVVVPAKARDPYEAKLREVFPGLGLPFSVVGESLAGGSTVARAALALLDFVSREVTQGRTLALFGQPALRGAASASVAERLLRRLAVRWGEDRAELRGTYVEEDLLTFGHAFRRAALSLFVDADERGELPIVEVGGASYLPVSLSSDEVDELPEVVLHLRQLFASRRALLAERRPLADHARLLRELFARELAAPDDEEDAMSALASVLDRLGRIASTTPLAFPVAAEIVSSALRGARTTRSAPLLGGITVAALDDAPFVPFRLACFVGLEARLFPATQARSPIDPELALPPGEPSPVEDQRHAFLARVLATREAVWLSWVSIDPRSDEPVLASPVVDDLSLVLSECVGRPLPRREVPLLRSDDLALARAVRAVRDEREAARAAATFTDAPRDLDDRLVRVPDGDLPRARAVLGLAPPPPARERTAGREITLRDLATFLLQPVQGAAKAALGIVRDDEERDDDEELLVSSFPGRAALLRGAFVEAFPDAGSVRRAYQRLARRIELAGEGPTGLFKAAETADHEERLAAFDEQVTPRVPLHTWVFGRSHLRGPGLRLLPPLALDDGLTLVGATTPYADATAVMLAPGDGSFAKVLFPFVSSLALAAAGVSLPPVVPLLVASGNGKPQRFHFRVPEAAPARELLALLAREIVDPSSSRFLPFDAIAKWHRTGEDLSACIAEKMEEASMGGVIAHPEEIPPPGPSDAVAIAKRRFSLFFEHVQVAS